jgi:hypothetical protein
MAAYLQQSAEEGQVLCIALAVATAAVIDCTQFLNDGCLVQIAHNGSGVCGYKFSANPVATANIDLSATSGATACAKLVPQSFSAPGVIPAGKPYLHLLATAIANISVHKASVARH